MTTTTYHTEHSAAPTALRWFTIGSVALISFSAFESLAVGTVLPSAAEELGATAQYSVAFGAAFAAMIVAVAWAGPWTDRSGVRPPLIVGGGLFSVGLVVVGVAHTMDVLAIGRAVQGFGSGLTGVVLYALVGRLMPEPGRPRIFATYSTAWVVPSLVGPAIAGLVADTVGWRWVFLGAAGPALLALLAILRATVGLDESGYIGRERPRRSLLVGALVAGAATALAQFAAPRGSVILLCLGAAALLIAGAALHFLLPVGTLLARSGIPRLVLTNLLVSGAFFSAEVYVPLYLVHIDRLSPFAAGSVMTGSALMWALAAQLQVRVPADGPVRERLRLIGAALVAVSTAGVAAVVALGAPWPLVFVAWGVGGLGMGLSFPTLSVLVLARSRDDEQGANSSALKLSESIGTAFATVIAGALFAQLIDRGAAGFAITLLVPTAAAIAATAVAARRI